MPAISRLAAFAAFVLVVVAMGALVHAQAPRRPDPSCVEGSYNSMLAAARRGDQRAIFCAAIYSALRYNNETMARGDRIKARADAFAFRRQAEELGFRFDKFVFYQSTFDQHIANADYDLNGGAEAKAEDRLRRQSDYFACSARVGTACQAQCGLDAGCVTSCTGGNAWQCNN